MKYDLNIQNDLIRFNAKVKHSILNKKKVEFNNIKECRTVQSNKYLHVLFALYGIEIGLTLEESKTFVKRSCPFGTYEKKNVKFLRKTSLFDTLEMTNFIDWFRTWSAQQGYYLPSSEEYIMQHLFIDNEIERNKEFL